MGISESAIKVLTEPVDHLIENCGHSDCHSKCCDCFEFDIEQHYKDSNTNLENKKI